MGEEGDGAHHEDRHHDAGDEPAEEQRADRDVRHHPVDDEGQRRRDDRAERRRGGGHADGEFGRIAVVLHGLDLDGAEAGRVGNGGARHAGEDHRADDVDVAEPALHPADEGHGEAIDAPGDAGNIHQVTGEDEERDGEQRKALDAGDHAVGKHHVRRDAGDENVEERCRRHGEGDGQSEQHQHDERAEKNQHHGTVEFERLRPLEHRIATPPVLYRDLYRADEHQQEAQEHRDVDRILGKVDRHHALIEDDRGKAPDQIRRVGEKGGAHHVDSGREHPRRPRRQETKQKVDLDVARQPNTHRRAPKHDHHQAIGGDLLGPPVGVVQHVAGEELQEDGERHEPEQRQREPVLDGIDAEIGFWRRLLESVRDLVAGDRLVDFGSHFVPDGERTTRCRRAMRSSGGE